MEELYDRYGPALYGVALRIVKRQVFAEEVVQDAFLKVWKNIDRYQPEKGRFFTWLYNITRNEAIDKRRSKEKRQVDKTKTIDATVYKIETGIYTETKVEDIGIKQLLNALDDDTKAVMDLVYFQGYTHQEVAEHTGKPLGTVKTKVRRALIKLRSVLVKE